MTKKAYTCRDVDLPHAAMVLLRSAGHLNLGVDTQLAETFLVAGIKPKTMPVWGAYAFWRFIGIAAFGVGIWWAFTSAWWWGLVGLAVMVVLGKANQKGNAENVIDAGMADAAFYERVRAAGGWLYQIDEAQAAQHRAAPVPMPLSKS